MVCVYCDSPTSVVNSRHQRRSNHVWRRRKCSNCGAVFTSTEQPEMATSFAVSNAHGRLEAFCRDLLFVSIYESCKHRPRAAQDASALTETVVANLFAHAGQNAIARNTIAQKTHDVLARFDHAAATSYAAFHPLGS